MELKIVRYIFNPDETIGRLFIDGVYFCDTLEPTERGLNSCLSVEQNRQLKIYGKTAVPVGEYALIMTYSPRFKRILPELLNVPSFEGVRIHSGNTKDDTQGCFLLGDYVGGGRLQKSRPRVDELCRKINLSILDDEGVRIKITSI